MAVTHGVVVDCADPKRLAAFWHNALGLESRMEGDDWVFLRNHAGGPHLSFQQVPEGKDVKNRVHLDVRPEGRGFEQERVRLEALGARSLQFFVRGEYSHYLMADPEGNESCLLTPGHASA